MLYADFMRDMKATYSSIISNNSVTMQQEEELYNTSIHFNIGLRKTFRTKDLPYGYKGSSIATCK